MLERLPVLMLHKLINIYFHFKINLFLVLYTAFNNSTNAFYLKRKFNVFLFLRGGEIKTRALQLSFFDFGRLSVMVISYRSVIYKKNVNKTMKFNSNHAIRALSRFYSS